MTPWYLAEPGRLTFERGAIDRLASSSDWLSNGCWIREADDLAYEFDMLIGGSIYEGRLVYPDLFPDAAPWIVPRKEERWSSHQFGVGGPLCLDIRNDNWHPGIAGAALIESAHRLVSTETPGPDALAAAVPSAHRSTEGQLLSGELRRAVISRGAWDLLHVPVAPPVRRLTFSLFLQAPLQRVVLTAVEQAGKLVPNSEVPKFNASGVFRAIDQDGYAFRCERSPPLPRITLGSDLIAYLEAAGFRDFISAENVGKAFFVALVGLPTRTRVFHVPEDLTGAATEYAVIGPDSGKRRLPARFAAIGAARVAIVGCGSVGSKVAVSLARSGARRFLLVDHDIFRPENLVRNELDWQHVAMHKVAGVRDRLNMVAAGIDVETIDTAAGAMTSARYMSYAYESIGTCDLIVDATASALAFQRLAGVARRRVRSMVWGELFAGGIGGLVARSRADLDAPPLEVRHATNEYLATLSEAPDRAAVDYDDVEAAGPLTASDADASFLASVMAQLSLDALVQPTPSRFPHAAYLFGLESAWEFSEPFEFWPINTPPKREGTAASADPAASAEAQAFVESLVPRRDAAA